VGGKPIEPGRVANLESVAVGDSVAQVAHHFENGGTVEVLVARQRVAKGDQSAREPASGVLIGSARHRGLLRRRREVIGELVVTIGIGDAPDRHVLANLDGWNESGGARVVGDRHGGVVCDVTAVEALRELAYSKLRRMWHGEEAYLGACLGKDRESACGERASRGLLYDRKTPKKMGAATASVEAPDAATAQEVTERDLAVQEFMGTTTKAIEELERRISQLGQAAGLEGSSGYCVERSSD
jgi:hypothetical protein